MKKMKPPPVARDMGIVSQHITTTASEKGPCFTSNAPYILGSPSLSFQPETDCQRNEILNLSHKNHKTKNTCVALKHSFEVDVYPQGIKDESNLATLPS